MQKFVSPITAFYQPPSGADSLFRRLTTAIFGAVLLAMAGHTTPVKALPVTYDEAAGDLSLNLQPFALGLGDNVFTGTTSFFSDTSQLNTDPDIDLDRFRFTILPDYQLSSVVLTVTSVFNNSDQNIFNIGFDARARINAVAPDTGISRSSPNAEVFNSNAGGPANLPLSLAIPEAELGLGAGLYSAELGFSSGAQGLGIVNYGYDYTLTLGVTPTAAVPEPSTVFILGTGLLMLAARRLRRQPR